jgi:hypothetical protein
MIVTKPQKPIKPIQPIKPIEPTKPKPPKKPVKHRKFGSEVSPPKKKPIPEFGTGGYVSALEDQDRRSGGKPNTSTTTTSTSSLSASMSGEWLNPPHPLPNYLGSDWMLR